MAKSTAHIQLDLTNLSTLIGRYFQIRDDYQNLVSTDVSYNLNKSYSCNEKHDFTDIVSSPQYEKQKGYGEDIDEGKYSLPLIHALQAEPHNMQLRNILVQRRVAGKSALAHKQLVFEHLKRTQSIQFTAKVLDGLNDEILHQVSKMEEVSGIANYSLRLLIDMLRV